MSLRLWTVFVQKYSVTNFCVTFCVTHHSYNAVFLINKDAVMRFSFPCDNRVCCDLQIHLKTFVKVLIREISPCNKPFKENAELIWIHIQWVTSSMELIKLINLNVKWTWLTSAIYSCDTTHDYLCALYVKTRVKT